MRMRGAWTRRLRLAETQLLPPPKLPALFVEVEDASLPDEEGASVPASAPFDGEKDVIGVVGALRGRRLRVTRRPGESVRALEARAQRLAPDVPLFFLAYASLEFSRQEFDGLPEAGAAA